MKTQSVWSAYLLLFGFLFSIIISGCNNTTPFTLQERTVVKDSVQLMAESIAKDISQKGPVGWLRYFENTQEFFMASDGQLVFPNIETATSFINNDLVRMISKIQLSWSNIRVDPLSSSLASISAVYHEDITDSAGKITPHDGYFTAIAHRTSKGWKLLNAHWSGKTTQ
jgi:hypothetical protein